MPRAEGYSYVLCLEGPEEEKGVKRTQAGRLPAVPEGCGVAAATGNLTKVALAWCSAVVLSEDSAG